MTSRSVFFRVLAASAGLLGSISAAPQWIWLSDQARDGEQAQFEHRFTVPAGVAAAQLSFTCDNGATAYLNDQKVAQNPDWNAPVKVNVVKFLKAGENVLRFDARNQGGVAGLVVQMKLTGADGAKSDVESGAGWKARAPGAGEWKPAVVIAAYGDAPWGRALSGAGGGEEALNGDKIQTLPGFKVERLYSVPKDSQGSWVALTEDDQGRLITSDQYGGLYRISSLHGGEPKVEALTLPMGTNGKPIGGAHGLLYAFGSLYVMNNEMSQKGLWRLQDTNGDDQFDRAELLRKCDGGGEHGTHGLVLAPDGKSIYFANGNHTQLPSPLDHARPVAIGEDHVITRLWDANGHARGILAPGGYVCRIDPEGKTCELFAAGFRNQYDIAFDANGELFTYDSDMEWDIGTPWYVPTRINHVVSGGDYGWRSGAGRWPDYYEDSLPAVIDIGPGSPTGTVFGTGAKFPEKYQRAFYALDWTYGTLWAIHLTPDGATFKASKEEFLTGKPLPLTDAIISRKDGAMYVTTGGRKSQSALYRVTYTGSESTAPAKKLAESEAARKRHELEGLHDAGTGPDAVAKAWPSLSSPDRFLRFAARVAIERQPSASWADRALKEENPVAAIEAMVALARVGDKSMQASCLESLMRWELAKLSPELRLSWVRAAQLLMTRMGKPSPEACARLAARLDGAFPSDDLLLNRELVALLVFVDSPTVVGKAVPLLATTPDRQEGQTDEALLKRNTGYGSAVAGARDSRPNRQAIAYAYALREARVGWTPELRRQFFSWFAMTGPWSGGNSFRGFLNTIRSEALTNCVQDPAERAALDTLSKQATVKAPTVPAILPKGPGKAYTVEEVVKLAGDGLKKRNFERGKAMFQSQLCVNCHHFNGDGGNTGPDITGSGSRYTIRDLAENIIEPSKVISDQYPSEILTQKDGNVVTGRVVVQENGKLFVMTAALAPEALTTVDEANVKSRVPSPVSMMPPGLLNALNEEELLDLFAYLLSGGNPNDPRFK